MNADIERVTTIDGQILYGLFEAVGWSRPRGANDLELPTEAY